ncbi:alpha/beta fold hydrolase [Actinocorallia aurea]
MALALSGRRGRPPARLVAAVAALVVAAGPGAVPAQAADLPVGNLSTALANFTVSPGRVAGANDWRCVPSPAHPTPVVLVHATYANLGMNWAALAPMLANAGYCVYALNYGMTRISLGRIGGVGDIAASADQLRVFVERVRRRTGAEKVDLVGHSQGGMMPSYYLKRLGGAGKVRRFVALAPSNHGTTLSGVANLVATFKLLGLVKKTHDVLQLPGLAQQLQESTFQKALFADGDTVPGPRYTVIATRRDWVVTPYTNAFLDGPNVRNITIQDQCPKDPVSHIGMFADSPSLQNVLNSLGPDDPAFRAVCKGYGNSFRAPSDPRSGAVSASSSRPGPG